MNSRETTQKATTKPSNNLNVSSYQKTTTAEEFDATAAALSRLSVLAGSADGSASPQPDDSVYETSTPGTCPSPSKRSSEFFDHAIGASEMKRLRRESTEVQAFEHEVHSFSNDFSLDTTQTGRSSPIELVGLGIVAETLRAQSPGSPAMTEVGDCSSAQLLDETTQLLSERAEDTLEAVPHHFSPILRRRACSAPVIPSARWLVASSQKRHHHKSSNRLRALLSSDSSDRHRKLSSQARKPPITQQTLKELELGEIFKNAQLRHDIVHDPNLQFRPNTDGERGAKKREEADKYWTAVAADLENVQQMSSSKLTNSCLLSMFEEMKNIMLSLVPIADRTHLCSTFDHEQFVQALHYGLFSPTRFAKYMSSLMKRHCAPMRDDAIDATVTMLEKAQCTSHFVAALRATFDVLEMMKLDVANHQLRSLRGFLLDSSVDFEKSWFTRKIANKSISPESGKLWFASLLRQSSTSAKPDYRSLFTNGLLEFLKARGESRIPSTFTFDQARLSALKKDVRDLVQLNLVLLLAKQLNKSISTEEIIKLKADLWILVGTERSRSADRWTNAKCELALHLLSYNVARNAQGLPVPPAASQISFAESWLDSHLSSQSPIFKMIEKRVLALVETMTYDALISTTINGRSTAPQVDLGIFDDCQEEVISITRRLSVVADFHWKVHGANYISWTSC